LLLNRPPLLHIELRLELLLLLQVCPGLDEVPVAAHSIAELLGWQGGKDLEVDLDVEAGRPGAAVASLSLGRRRVVSRDLFWRSQVPSYSSCLLPLDSGGW